MLHYWRVEKADSVIVIPKQGQTLFLPPPTYRPGVQTCTWDFPGGRASPDVPLPDAARQILTRELGVLPHDLVDLKPINSEGWLIDSSFSNQRLYGFIADIEPQAVVPAENIGAVFQMSGQELTALFEHLTCLQCRALLLEWLRQESRKTLPA